MGDISKNLQPDLQGTQEGDIIIAPEKDTETLRSKVKDVIDGDIRDLIGDQFADEGIIGNIVDSIFNVLDITLDDQDIEGAKVVVYEQSELEQIESGLTVLDDNTESHYCNDSDLDEQLHYLYIPGDLRLVVAEIIHAIKGECKG
ncbi:hypothetical protein LCGC14_2669350 [marine sediment metagenome]|uniref:Uncharacterized protein n=1 Tax=marine sediment metagenome TaxID=412755 RepID=A0A0F9ABZ0_9ZZZZ